MKFQVRKSLIASTDLFDIEVAAFAKEVRDWLAREAKVKEEEGRTDIAPIDRHHSYPAPSAHPLIVQAVNLETGIPEYEYVDDPIEIIKERLAHDVLVAASVAMNEIVPPAKRRSMELRHENISKADLARTSAMVAKHTGLMQRLKLKSVDYDAVTADVAAMRPEEENSFLAEVEEKRKLLDDVHAKLVQAHSDIEDLTPDTVGSYQLPKF